MKSKMKGTVSTIRNLSSFRPVDWLILKNISPFVCFGRFRIHLQLCCLKDNEHALLEKHKRLLASEPDHRQIGLCMLPLRSAQSTPPNARWVPNARVLILQNRSTFSFGSAFRSQFTVKRYGMKHYPFLFVSNIATTKNNSSLGHIASILISYDQNHNMLQLANRHLPIVLVKVALC